jgi:hypothetical protein
VFGNRSASRAIAKIPTALSTKRPTSASTTGQVPSGEALGPSGLAGTGCDMTRMVTLAIHAGQGDLSRFEQGICRIGQEGLSVVARRIRLCGCTSCRSVGRCLRGDAVPSSITRTRQPGVHPTGQKSKKYPQVEGHVLYLSGRHAKLRREGYRRHEHR